MGHLAAARCFSFFIVSSPYPLTFMSRRRRSLCRSASLCITLFGTVTNTAIAIQVLSAWQNLKWGEVESEWAGDSWPQVIDGVKVMWALLSLYFASAAAVSAIGLVGIIRNKISLVKFYRDYSIVDFSFCALATLGATYASFMSSARAGICEEFSHHPELMRDLFEVGLNPENCEHWLVRAMIALIGAMFILLVIRLSVTAALSACRIQLLLSAQSPILALFIKQLLLIVKSSANTLA
ncbi:hypothetical protein D9756_000309 [Leucocoprinus leucothites]|uniref:Uncharacterized protein n=1 Tax=Leucocoprinus leucothites TaxID=201217 RepID=A0A8H5GEW1_9AGAR|nr:hypothetical protein D9756_000309 [Leucoagaricus leucothites]